MTAPLILMVTWATVLTLPMGVGHGPRTTGPEADSPGPAYTVRATTINRPHESAGAIVKAQLAIKRL